MSPLPRSRVSVWLFVALLWNSIAAGACWKSSADGASAGDSRPLPNQPTQPSRKEAPVSDTGLRLWSWNAPRTSQGDASLARDDAQAKQDTPAVAVRLRGRIQADAILVNQSEPDKAIIGNIQNVVGFRRARLGAAGSVGEQVAWVAEFEFAGGGIAFKDVLVEVKELPLLRRVYVGHMQEPFSLEGATSSNYMPFVERSPIAALDPFFNWGVAFASYTENERFTLAAGIFRSGTDNTGTDSGDGNDLAYTVRLTALPWYDDQEESYRLMHLGAAFSQRFPKNDQVTFNQGAQSNLLQIDENALTPFVRNITIPASQNQLYNLEWATVLGPCMVQAEWSATTIDELGGNTVFLWGTYGLASFFLTGEHHTYLTKDGAFGVTHVREPFLCLHGPKTIGHGPGAWELLARVAYLDFDDANIPRSTNGLPLGNKLTQLTLGINWYWNDNARFMFNYVHAIPIDPTFGPSAADAFFIQTALYW